MSSRDQRIASLLYNYSKGKPWLSTYRKYYGRKLSTYSRSTRRPLGLPATRGYRGQYGKYKRAEKELKVVEVQGPGTFGNISSVANGGVFLLNGCAQGSDYTQRVGREIMIKSLFIRGFTQLGSANESDVQRVVVVLDTQANGTTPVFGDIFNNVTAALTFADPSTLNNLSNRDRFRIIIDKAWPSNVSNSSSLQAYKTFKKFKKLNIKVTYNGTGATAGAIQTNAIWLFLLGIYNQTANPTFVSSFNFVSRIRFNDC